MNRRRFLAMLGLAAVAAALPKTELRLPTPADDTSLFVYDPGYIGVAGTRYSPIADYADYISLSDLAIATSLDPHSESAALSLASSDPLAHWPDDDDEEQ